MESLPTDAPSWPLSPERAGSLNSDFRASSDIYEVGLMMWQALLGEPLYQGSSNGWVESQMTDRLPALSPALPRPLRAALRRMLELEPRHRYQSYPGLDYDLSRLLDGEHDFCIGVKDTRQDLAMPDFAGDPGTRVDHRQPEGRAAECDPDPLAHFGIRAMRHSGCRHGAGCSRGRGVGST